MVIYWDARWREGGRSVKGWLIVGIVIGLVMLIPMHESSVIGAVLGNPLPGEVDPLRRVRAWKETSAEVERARQDLLMEGEPVFIIADHYGMAGEFSFYDVVARDMIKREPLVYSLSSVRPKNQLYFWPEYRYVERRKGQNAIFALELNPYPLEKGWLWKWLKHKKPGYGEVPLSGEAPEQIVNEFESVKNLGTREVKLGDRVFRRVQLFECRNLK
jgi:hypothetical protein